MSDKKKSIGAFWTRKSAGGKEFHSGNIEINGEKIQLVMFPNGYKDADNKPDFLIYESEPMDKKEEDTTPF